MEDRVDGVVVPMRLVLAPLAPDAERLRWTILDLGDAYLPEGSWVYDLVWLERRVRASPTGFELTFTDLTAFAGATRQVIDGLFVGCSTSAPSPLRSDTDGRILEKADMVVAAFDSTFWLVGADDAVLARVEESFDEVAEQDSVRLRVSAWGRTTDG